MSSSLFSSFQENTKCESSFFADTCTRRVPIFGMSDNVCVQPLIFRLAIDLLYVLHLARSMDNRVS
jgi:hypothetical protein